MYALADLIFKTFAVQTNKRNQSSSQLARHSDINNNKQAALRLILLTLALMFFSVCVSVYVCYVISHTHFTFAHNTTTDHHWRLFGFFRCYCDAMVTAAAALTTRTTSGPARG